MKEDQYGQDTLVLKFSAVMVCPTRVQQFSRIVYTVPNPKTSNGSNPLPEEAQWAKALGDSQDKYIQTPDSLYTNLYLY